MSFPLATASFPLEREALPMGLVSAGLPIPVCYIHTKSNQGFETFSLQQVQQFL
ncbi:MAG: hypothetical protein SCG84_05100 [Nitrosomonadaceae bacterium]|nr:hypothetical protein [Nitrosospira sp.]MDW7597771.1 hypothetical protein [Nitrosomonadaceae bacterium]MBI0411118.1 hypothetical protein [Nitrosospira sp.]MDW7619243.1 hypothetical protein [Nitrosomonadaceae bacterium]MDW7647503.1 hypothetical protein [Nitrosomonadaceae bacterium]